MVNLRSVDLNLLVVLDVLLEEVHVSRAAQRLGLSQPATSAALQRCRELFRDDLLERSGAGMQLSSKAQALRAPLKSALSQATQLLGVLELPLKEMQQTIRIAVADYSALFVVSSLLAELQDTAPRIDLVIQPWNGSEAAKTGLVNGTTDIAIGVFPLPGGELYCEELFVADYVVAMRKNHPAASSFDLQTWLSYPHLHVSVIGSNQSPVDTALAEQGFSRRIGLVVPTFQMVPPLLEVTDLMAVVPSRSVIANDRLITRSPPIPVNGFKLNLAWHKRNIGNRAIQHVAELSSSILRDERRTAEN